MPGIARVDDEWNAASLKLAGQFRGWTILEHEVQDDELGSVVHQPCPGLYDGGHGLHLETCVLKVCLDRHGNEGLIFDNKAAGRNDGLRQHGNMPYRSLTTAALTYVG